jgi:hypothetical protein
MIDFDQGRSFSGSGWVYGKKHGVFIMADVSSGSSRWGVLGYTYTRHAIRD